MGRRPITIVEIEQKRCVNTFGSAPCTATGTPKCYNCIGTCRDLPNIDNTGSIKWRFVDDRPGIYDFADHSDPDNLELDPIACLVSVSTSENKINAGSNLDGVSPFGITGKATVSFRDVPWNDVWGDPYLADRSGYVAGKVPPNRANFWALWTARNPLFTEMYLRIYDGYEGQDLADMRSRLYVLDSVDGPDESGRVTVKGVDPLRLTDGDQAEFPRTSKLDVYGDIDDITTTVRVFGVEADLSDDFGNTGDRKWLVAGNELILYTGYTDDGDGVFTLTGVVRGDLGTVAGSHNDQDKLQRAGRYEDISFWLVLDDLVKDHTEIPDDFVDLAGWNLEGETYLPTYKTNRTIIVPTAVKKLAGELSQQGLYYVWWSEYEQLIKMLAIRPPEAAPITLNDSDNLLRGTVLTRDPKARLTQVAVYYNQIDVFGGDDDDANYSNRFTAIDGENLGETRAAAIYAPWISNRTQAVQLAVRLLIRYKAVPKFLSVTVDANDRDAIVGSVVDIDTAAIVDTEGNLNTTRWQVISAKEVKAGHSYMLDLQTYEFIGKFGVYMADGSPDYADATDEEKATGAWFAADTGLLPDGTEGYQYQ